MCCINTHRSKWNGKTLLLHKRKEIFCTDEPLTEAINTIDNSDGKIDLEDFT